MLLETLLKNFNQDRVTGPVTGIHLEAADYGSEIPVHQHRQGQLILAMKGGVTCEVAGAIWMVPPRYAVWVPGMMPHSVHATANARLCYLYVQPGTTLLPGECCTLAISPLVHALILDIADRESDYVPDSPTGRKAAVLLEELATMPVERLHLPTSGDPRMRKIIKMLSDDPADRRTLAQWSELVAMSERSLARLVRQETGLTFGRWRQQLHLIIALRQLAAGQTVQRVAEELGYESVTAFITMFKKSLGKPPGKYFASIS
jgi:AraC-like DNA-binding protein